MGAVGLHQPNAAAEVAKGHQFLAENFQGNGDIGELVGVAHGLPEPAQILAARRGRADVGQFSVLFKHLRMMIGAVFGRQEGRSGGCHVVPPDVLLGL